MSAISHKNLQELCRACLRTLKRNNPNAGEKDSCDAGVDGTSPNLNNLLLPNLCKLFMFLTSYDVNRENEDFPKRLCEWCYGRLMDYDEFRKLSVRSTEMLYEKWNARQPEEVCNKEAPEMVTLIKCEQNDDENDDDKLLLPELANMPINIKPEPLFEAMETQFTLPSFLEEGEINRDQELYESYDSEEDADDEELLLPNGAANNSSPSIISADGKVNKNVRPKKDRDKRTLHCNACNKQFYKQVYLDAHVRGTHLGQEKPFQCSYCTKSFTRYKQLFLHTKSQHIEMLFRCDYQNCDATFSVAVKLKAHRQVAHNSSEEVISPDWQDVREEEPQDNEPDMDHTCQMCWRKYSSKRALREHIKRHKQIKDYVCQECGVAKVTRTELRTHMRIHTPNLEKFPCPQCPQVFNHKNAISRHVRVIHEGLRRFPCTYCPKKFGTRNSQVCHERLHTGERPYICQICDKGFVQQEGLRSHMKNHDKNLRKHVCRYCKLRFITLKNLTDHERRHSGDKPNICNICSRGFYKAEDLRKHYTTHFDAEDAVVQGDSVENQKRKRRTKT